MRVRINKGNHWPNILQRLFQLGIYRNKKSMERVVEFDITAKYDLRTDNDDVNKLFGWGYFSAHHKDSVRFGWNWNNENSTVRLFAYYYMHGHRDFKLVCEVPLNKKFLLTIERKDTKYIFQVFDAKNDYIIYGVHNLEYSHHKKWSYRLGVYFGGNNPAPHDITIKISKT